MIFCYFFVRFSSLFSVAIASHFLGGSFTYRTLDKSVQNSTHRAILVEVRFHISDHYFHCTPEQVNSHAVLYLIGEAVPYDSAKNTYLWYEAEAFRRNKHFYDIECVSVSNKHGCNGFQEKVWAHCESTNQKSGYSIIRRQFSLVLGKQESVRLTHTSCCWANSINQQFYFELLTEAQNSPLNSSPYPYIPASYYVDFKQPTTIPVFISDADGDDVICEPFSESHSTFLTVHASSSCTLTYQTDRIGKQFGQFWIIDQNKKQSLTRSLVSVQVHVLTDVLCNTQPDISVVNKAGSTNTSTVHIEQSVYLSVTINANCLLVRPQDQTITELTTSCSNSQPVVLANGGIEMTFECKANLCEKYPVCFVGEFALKLPSTAVRCHILDVVGKAEQCAQALKNYDFLQPRKRHFMSSQLPVTLQTVSGSTRTPLAQQKSPSRRWLWFLIAAVFLLLLGFVGTRQALAVLRRQTSPEENISRSSIVSDTNTKQMYTAVPSLNLDDETPKKVKSRSQYIRQTTFDDTDL